METHTYIQPRWHMTIKWLATLFIFPILSATLVASVLFLLTERNTAISVSTHFIASAFSPQGLDDPEDIHILQEALRHDPDYHIELIPGVRIPITHEDTLTRTPRELRLYVFRHITEPLYEQGPHGLVEQYVDDPEEAEQFISSAFFLRFFTKETHDMIQTILLPLFAVTALLFALIIYFSRGMGRLLSPGFILVAAGVPSLLFFIPLPEYRQLPVDSTELHISDVVGHLLHELFPLIQHIHLPFTIALSIGIALVLGALVGSVMHRMAAK